MLNVQPKEHLHRSLDGSLDVIDIWLTIQGEGPYAGRPAVFVRLAGCNLECPLCDTNYTQGRHWMFSGNVHDAIKALFPTTYKRGPLLVVITGGEPFRQDLAPLINRLFRDPDINTRLVVQIETNGTLYPGADFPWGLVTIVCSPKTGEVNPAMKCRINAWKYVLQADHIDLTDGLPLSVLGMSCRVARPLHLPGAEIFVQPLDEGDPVNNTRNIAAVVDVALKYNYRLCLQTHKLLGLP